MTKTRTQEVQERFCDEPGCVLRSGRTCDFCGADICHIHRTVISQPISLDDWIVCTVCGELAAQFEPRLAAIEEDHERRRTEVEQEWREASQRLRAERNKP